jgi:hypothetical protein
MLYILEKFPDMSCVCCKIPQGQNAYMSNKSLGFLCVPFLDVKVKWKIIEYKTIMPYFFINYILPLFLKWEYLICILKYFFNNYSLCCFFLLPTIV